MLTADSATQIFTVLKQEDRDYLTQVAVLITLLFKLSLLTSCCSWDYNVILRIGSEYAMFNLKNYAFFFAN